MTGVFVYLTWSTLRNRIRVRLRRLREPRYLIGAVVGGLYFYFFLFRRAPRPGPGGGPVVAGGLIALFERFRGTFELGGSVALFIFAALAWILPSSGSAIGFTQSEVHFLFPAPIRRAELIRYRIIRSQLGVFIGSALMTVFFRPSSLAGGWTFFLGISIVITAINLHLMGVSLSRQSLEHHGRAALVRQWLPMTLVAGVAITLVTAVAMDWSRLSGLDDVRAVLGELQRVGLAMPAAIVLWPFRAFVRLPLSPTPMDFLRALPAAALLVFLNYRWVIRSDVAFEEASAAAAAKVAAAPRGRAAAQPRVRSMATPFTLALDGRPETAIFWKNLILVGRYASLRTLLRFIPAIVVLGIVISRAAASSGVTTALAFIAAWFGGVTVLMGPQLARNDLRQDLTQLAVLKTWPVRGAALIRGEIAAPAAVLTAVAWLCTLAAMVLALGLPASDMSWTRTELLAIGVGVAAVSPGLILVQLVVHNALAVMFPAWVVIGGARARGVEVMGQRMLMMLGIFVALALSLLPAALVAGAVGAGLYALTRTIPIVIPAIIVAIVLIVECLVATEMLGGLLERTDISALNVEE